MIHCLWLQDALDLLDANREFVLATVVSPETHPLTGRHLIVDPYQILSMPDAGLRIVDEDKWSAAVQSVAETQSARLQSVRLGGRGAEEDVIEAAVFFAHCGPQSEAWIFGAGHIACALAPLLANLGWRVVVTDDRAEFASAERFPNAAEIRTEAFETSAQECARRARPWIVLVTRGHQHDIEILKAVAQQPGAAAPRYMGMIGSKRRVAAVRKHLIDQKFPSHFVDSLHAPIGLPIGADTPAEIAVSIASEMVAVRRGRRWDTATQSLRLVRNESIDSTDTAGRLELWRAAANAVRSGHNAVLATVVERRGSTPRGPGAQMAVFGNGSFMGTIGGGCGEGTVLRTAREMLLGGGGPRLLHIDLTADTASESSDVCGGRYSVFLEIIG